MRALGHGWQQTTVTKTEAADRPIRLNEAASLAALLDLGVDDVMMSVQAGDPDAGKITLAHYLDTWLAAQTSAESSRESTETRVRVHIRPELGERPLRTILPSHIQAWVRGLQRDGVAPSYIKTIFANLSAVLNAAVDDDLIRRNPCNAGTVKLPRLDPSKVQAWEPEDVIAVQDALPQRYRVMALLGAQCGLRQGEIFGLGVEHVDFMRGKIHVCRQVKIVRNKQVFDLPKGGKSRVVDGVPDDLLMMLSRHLQRWPAATVTLPWQKPGGRDDTVCLVLSTREGTALQRNYICLLYTSDAADDLLCVDLGGRR